MAEDKAKEAPSTSSGQDKKDDKKEVEVPKEFEGIISEIEKMSVLELSKLVKVLEEKFDISAAAPVAIAAAPASGDGEAAAEEKSSFNIELTAAGENKISAIKAVREITGQGLKEAKDMVDAAPKVIKENVPKEEAEAAKKLIEEAGAKCELK
ncbi:MAG: 50S ribosomal protein L7/L12 [bacterium]